MLFLETTECTFVINIIIIVLRDKRRSFGYMLFPETTEEMSLGSLLFLEITEDDLLVTCCFS